MSGSTFQVLALSGGGYRGLYTAQVLADVEKTVGGSIATRFDLLAGTSVGGILALALAFEIPAARIVELFQEHGAEIFARRSRVGLTKSNYPSDPLRALLSARDLFGDRTLADCRHPLLVPTINFTTGKPQLFKTAHHPSFQSDRHHRAVDVALATSAAPMYFPRHVFNSCQYVDGGLYANAPGQLALHEAEYFFKAPLEQIRLLAVGTMSAAFTVNPDRSVEGGMTSWGGWNPVNTPKQLFGLAISVQETAVHYMLGHRLGDRYYHVDSDLKDEQARAVGLDTATPAATAVLVGSAHERAKWALGDDKFLAFLKHEPPQAVFHQPPP